jgi:hypothetical protein
MCERHAFISFRRKKLLFQKGLFYIIDIDAGVSHRVARWYIFKPKIPTWVNFGGPWNGKGWYILWPFGIY